MKLGKSSAPPRSDLEEFTKRVRQHDVIPTWEDAPQIVPKEPKMLYEPYLWPWSTMRSLLTEAGETVTPERGAERRSLDHVNPSLKASLSTTHALGTAFQLVRPGEVAPAHRHTAAAIRFVFEGGSDSTYTVVNGEPLQMCDRDLLLTPNWAWHDHRNTSDHDIIWFDALDYPLVNYFRAGFFEPYPGDKQEDRLSTGYSSRYSGLVRPAVEPYRQEIPVVRYPWADVAAILDTEGGHAHPAHGTLLRYADPFGPGGTLPTFSCFVQRLPSGFAGVPWRSTASRVLLALEGSGEVVVGDARFSWARGDVIAIPPWSWVEHRCSGDADALFFVVSEQPVLESLRLYREELGQ